MIFWGVGGAVVLRILFAAVATQLLTIVGLTLAGGILLLWVCWKMYREITLPRRPRRRSRACRRRLAAVQTMTFGRRSCRSSSPTSRCRSTTCWRSPAPPRARSGCWRSGLTVAVVFMALLSTYIAKLLARYHWITWVGLAIVLYVALEMIWTGTHQVGCQFVSKAVCDSGALRTLSTLLS